MRGDLGKWEVRVDWVDYNYELRIFIVRWCEGEWVEYITKIEGNKIEFKRVKYNERIEPAMVFGRANSNEIMQAFAECCYKNGFMPKEKPVIENELTATKYHLEDMRKLLKLK